MSDDANRKAVWEFVHCMKEKDSRRLAEIFTEDFQWVVPARSPTLDELKTPRNKEVTLTRMKAYFDSMAAPIEFEPFGWTVDGDRLAVEFEGRINWDNGKEYNNLYHFLFEMRDGKIRRMTEYCDLLYAWETSPVIAKQAEGA